MKDLNSMTKEEIRAERDGLDREYVKQMEQVSPTQRIASIEKTFIYNGCSPNERVALRKLELTYNRSNDSLAVRPVPYCKKDTECTKDVPQFSTGFKPSELEKRTDLADVAWDMMKQIYRACLPNERICSEFRFNRENQDFHKQLYEALFDYVSN